MRAMLAVVLVATCSAGAHAADYCDKRQAKRAIALSCTVDTKHNRSRAELEACAKEFAEYSTFLCVQSLKLSLAYEQSSYDLSYTVTNNGSRPVKDVNVACQRYGGSGTPIAGSARASTAYQLARPGGTMTARIPYFYYGWEQQSSVKCLIVGAQAAD